MLVTRRKLLLGAAGAAAVGGIGLAVGWRPAERYFNGDIGSVPDAAPVGPWVHVAPDGTVTVLTTVVEIGQGSQSGIAQLVAEELDVEWAAVRVAHAPLGRRYLYRYPMTGGSASIRESFEPMRRVGAAARAMLVRAASRQWDVHESECATRNGRVVHRPSGRTLDYGALAIPASRLRVPRDVPIKDRSRWSLIGRAQPRVDTRPKCDGSALFGSDLAVPGMQHAAIAHAPTPGARLLHLNERAAIGTARIVRQPSFVAVVARDWWTASRALGDLAPQWEVSPGTAADDLASRLRAALDTPGQPVGTTAEEARDRVAAAERALRTADRVIERTYEVPLLAHAPMETPGALAVVRPGRVEIHASVQDPLGARAEVARTLRVPERDVVVHPALAGGGFGRRLTSDYVVEAALVAREAGVPVRLTWSRAEDVRFSTYRPAAACRLRAAISRDGELTGIRATVATAGESLRANLAAACPYSVPVLGVDGIAVPVGLRIGSWRSVDASQHTFFVESFVDEIAAEIGTTPLTLRLRLLEHEPRLVRVLNAAVEMSGYGRTAAPGTAQGLAVHRGFGSYTAQVCTVEHDGAGRIRVRRVDNAFDCGTALNPDSVRAQFEGGVHFALAAACWQKITLRDGRVAQANFDTFPLGTIADSPVVETRILDSPEAAIGGAGEPPVPGVAPALAAAVAALTGTRRRRLPLFADPD